MVKFNVECEALKDGQNMTTRIEVSKAEENDMFSDGTYPMELSTENLLFRIPGTEVMLLIKIKDLDLILKSTRG